MYKIPVYRHTDETFGFMDIGMDYPMTDCESCFRYFVNIDSIGEFIDKVDKTTYGTVCSGGNEYITTLSLEKLIRLVLSKESYYNSI